MPVYQYFVKYQSLDGWWKPIGLQIWQLWQAQKHCDWKCNVRIKRLPIWVTWTCFQVSHAISVLFKCITWKLELNFYDIFSFCFWTAENLFDHFLFRIGLAFQILLVCIDSELIFQLSNVDKHCPADLLSALTFIMLIIFAPSCRFPPFRLRDQEVCKRCCPGSSPDKKQMIQKLREISRQQLRQKFFKKNKQYVIRSCFFGVIRLRFRDAALPVIIDDYAKDGGPSVVWLLRSFYRGPLCSLIVKEVE